jgi:3-hydroxyisobutyrate dehydrogenase-like beta-hydroxyacid dehydrogenase
MRIGVIGLGNIGGHVAANLVQDGHQVTVHDADAARVQALVEKGAAAADGAEAVARASEVTFLSLPAPEVVRGVVDEWLRGAQAGSVVVDLSTNTPGMARELGARLEAAGCQLLEAPLTGGAPGAKHRKLVFLVGGAPAVFERCRPLLDELGRAVFHFGPLGLGNTAKLVNSLLAFTATWVSLEGLAIAAKAGIDLRTMVEAVRTGGAGNFYMDRMVEGVNQRGRPPQFALELAAKDAALISQTAERAGVAAPVAAAIAHVLESAASAGLGKNDWSDLVEWIERQSSTRIQLPPKGDGP